MGSKTTSDKKTKGLGRFLDVFTKDKETEGDRKHYRVPTQDRPAACVAIVQPSGSLKLVDLIDTSAGGLKFSFGRNLRTPPEVGDELPLKIWAEGESGKMSATVIVRRIERQRGIATFGCQFINAEGFYQKVTPKLWKAFNRRGSFRVSPPHYDQPEISISWGNESLAGTLKNISAGGLAILFKGKAEFSVGLNVSLTFALIEMGPLLNISAEVRHQSLHKGKTVIGVQFDNKTDKGTLNKILGYVSAQQTRVIQAKADAENLDL